MHEAINLALIVYIYVYVIVSYADEIPLVRYQKNAGDNAVPYMCSGQIDSLFSSKEREGDREINEERVVQQGQL